MKVNKYNAERYYDPTAYEALCGIEREAKKNSFRPLVFICSPFAGDVEGNTQKAKSHCRFAVSQNRIPLAPHLLFPQFMDDSDATERNLGLFFGSVLLTKCNELWVFGDRISSGMAIEIEKAKHRKLIIRYFDDEHKEVHPYDIQDR